jgi:hypothetical protein
MTAKLTLIAPEILLFIGSVVVAVLGLSRTPSIRRSVPVVHLLWRGQVWHWLIQYRRT